MSAEKNVTAVPAKKPAKYSYQQYEYSGSRRDMLEESPIHYYLNIVRRRIWIIIACFVVAATIGLVNAARAPKVFQATAKVLVERQMPRIMRFDSLMQEYTGWDPEYYSTQAELARSRAVLERVLQEPRIKERFEARTGKRKFSLRGELKRTILALIGGMPAPPPEPWEMLKGQIRVSHLKDTHFLLIRSEGGDPKWATVVVNAVAQALVNYHVEMRTEALGEAFDFLEEEKARQEEYLMSSERELQAFRESAKEVTLAASEKDQPALQRLSEMSEKLTQIQMDLVELTAELKVVREVLRTMGERTLRETNERLFSLRVIQKDQRIAELHSQLVEARSREVKLSEIYGPDHPMMRDAGSDVARIEKEFTDWLRQVVLALESQAMVLRSKESELLAQQGEQKGRALDLAKEVFTFTRLQNTVARHQKLYDALVERMREIDVSSGYIRTNANLVEKAAVPVVPIRPNRTRIALMSMLVGLMFGLGLAFLTENLDDTIKTPEDLKERLQVPLLGFVPRIEPEEKETDSGTWFESCGLVSVQKPTSSASEAYRNIRTKLFFSIPAGETRILGFTSCNPGEGKTTTSSNLALVTAMAGKKTLLIDADIHRPMIHRVFGLDGKKGLTSVLSGQLKKSEVLQRFVFESTVSEYLDLITAGPGSDNPSELIGSGGMRDLLAWAREHYDWVFVDIPPLLFISDASIMSALCEGVVLVVRAGKNNRSILNRTKEQLYELNANVVGCILNDVVISRMGRYYSDYSYYGYSRYSSNYHKSYYSEEERPKSKKGRRKKKNISS